MSNFNINRMSGIQYNSISQTSKASSPDWEKTPHKGMERPSEAEFGVMIDELAKGLAEARYNNDSSKYASLSSAGDKMRAQYISSVSPDRKSMVKEASELMKQSRSEAGKKETDKPMNLIDYLNKKDGIGEYGEEGRSRNASKSGTTVVLTGSDLELDTFEIKGSKAGQTVMGYASGNWYHVNTPEEQNMQQKFLSRLNKAEDRYYRQFINDGSMNYGQNSDTATVINNRVDYTV
jgi:hypothetical protein